MRRLGRFLPALLLCGAAHAALIGAAQAMNADESPTGWWAPTLRDCADPASPRAFEIRLRPAAEARLEAHDLRCRIDRVSDTAIGYRLHMRCYRSAADLRADAGAQARQIVVDAIGPVTMRADGQRVYRCRSRPAASAAEPRSVAAGEATVPALPLPDAPMRLAALPPEAPPTAPAPAPAPGFAAAPGLVPVPNPASSASPAPVPTPPAVSSPAAVPSPAAEAPARMAALPAEPLPASPAPVSVAPTAVAPPHPLVSLMAVQRGKVVGYPGTQAPGTIVVDTASRLLYLVRGDGTAIRYRVAVGRPGTTWKGVETVTAKQEWPQWTPTPEMRRSRPGLPRHVAGGPRNPLGARALYLGSSLYRIHGTTNPGSIGRAASAGCFRMLNEDVIELYRFVPVGTKVQVI